MYFKRINFSLLFSLAVALLASNVQAYTIGGKDYKELVSFNTIGDFGYWTKGPKYFTFLGNNDYVKPILVGGVKYLDSSLSGTKFSQVLAMGTMTTMNVSNTALDTGSITLYGPGNQILLTAKYKENGNLSAIGKLGTAGELDVKGIYQVTGGSLFASDKISGQLYIDISFNNVWRNNTGAGDLRANMGTFTFYQLVTPTGGGTGNPVPEPASMLLLGLGALGGAVKRSRNKA